MKNRKACDPVEFAKSNMFFMQNFEVGSPEFRTALIATMNGMRGYKQHTWKLNRRIVTTEAFMEKATRFIAKKPNAMSKVRIKLEAPKAISTPTPTTEPTDRTISHTSDWYTASYAQKYWESCTLHRFADARPVARIIVGLSKKMGIFTCKKKDGMTLYPRMFVEMCIPFLDDLRKEYV